MSLLPQHKKSAGELAKLRESLGIPDHSPVEDESPAVAPTPAVKSWEKMTTPKISKAPPESPPPLADAHAPKPVRSFKRSERGPALPVAEGEVLQASAASPEIHAGPKLVRSLRKSEQGPLHAASEPPPDSPLPLHRHSEREIQQIRRQETLALPAAAIHPLALKAHPALVIPGYLFAIAAAVGYHFYDLQIPVTGPCVAVALLVAAIIYFKKPLSLHHAAFIAVMSLFVIVFGALYYFPQLQHGT